MTRKQKRTRRGALLIVVLSMLVLFALIALTFVVVAGSFNRSAKAAGRVGITDDEGRQLVERAFLELLRGTTNPNSALFTDDDDGDGTVDEDAVDGIDPPGRLAGSLLEDLYGDDGILITANVASPDAAITNPLRTIVLAGLPLKHYNAYAGCTLSVRNGNAVMLSTRIALSIANGANTLLYLEPFAHPLGSNVYPSTANNCIINGRPFNGAGVASASASLDEPWDAPDRFNPHLAFIPADAPATSIVSSFANRLIPLIDANNDGVVNAQDRVAIDNDRDGILDSGWIDLGAAIKTAADGRRYKPFYSILCIDLDGRLNLNAHGNLGQLQPNYSAGHAATWAGAGGTTQTQDFPRGMGFGPAEVRLDGLFSSTTKHQALLEARYGPDLAPGPGGASIDNNWRIQGMTIPNDYAATTVGGTAQGYASSPDVFGGGGIGVDNAGRPITFNMGVTGEFNSSPYQINVVKPNGADRPITAHELERILRFSDIDVSSLPAVWARNNALSAADFSSLTMRRSITTHSSYLPVPAANLSAILAKHLQNAGIAEFTTPNFPRNNEVRKMLEAGIVNGGRMNVNRLWGNGVDNNSNGIVDDTVELATSETLATLAPSPYAAAPTADYLNRAPDLTNQSFGRFHFARQLYTLMFLLSDRGYKLPITESTLDTDDTKKRELTVRRMAQWAINCVDARDPDAIMTPFEYDVNPLNGWNVDGDLATNDSNHADRRVVWGCEFPELRFSESLATHDRRVRDTDWDNNNDPADEHPDPVANPLYTMSPGRQRLHPDWTAAAPGNTYRGDKDLDQFRIPQGSLFLELYCTRPLATQNPVLPRELYTAGGELDLQRRDNNNAGNYPVWRVAISEPQSGTGVAASKLSNSAAVLRATRPDSVTFQPPHMSLYNSDYTSTLAEYVDATTERDTAHNLAIERYICFSTVVPAGDEYRAFRHRAGATSVAPGEYLVVGPRKKTFFGSLPDGDDNPKDLAATGRAAAAPTLEATQIIDFQGTGTGIAFTDSNGAPATYPKPVKWMIAGADAPAAWANAANTAPTGIGVNVSEPLPSANYYDEPDEKLHTDADIPLDAYGDGTAVTKTFPDVPFDSVAGRPIKDLGLEETAKTENFRTAFLQRLANPLLAYNAVTNPYITVDWIPIDLSVYNGEDYNSEEAKDEFTGADAAATVEHPGWFGPFDPDDDAGVPNLGTRHIAGANQNLWSQETVAQTHDAAGDVDVTTAYLQHSLKGTLGFLNESFGQPYASGAAAGDPQNGPFPWLFWPNRPYFNEYELALIPATQGSRILHEFTSAETATSPYDSTNPRGMFRHLLNIFHSSNTAGESGHFYRIFDFLEVPSRYAGTVQWYPPTYAPAVAQGFQFRAPSNGLTRFRDPGRININTIPGPVVWHAIDRDNGTGTAAFTSWESIDASRRGVPDAFGRFANPFRQSINAVSDTEVTASNVNQTFLRKGFNSATSTETNAPMLGAPLASAQPKDPTQHAYFQLQGLIKTGNILSTQSNVYAIWITVGYFEVDDAGVPVRELSSETGDVQRHRGFYIIDRSIPVAFERGQDHNVENAVLLRRFIE